MTDFTLSSYHLLLKVLLEQHYTFLPFAARCQVLPAKAVILRHDVDKLPLNSLQTAKIEYELGIQGTYYFRIVRQSFDVKIIKEIAALGHEIGYHYENMDLLSRRIKGGNGQLIDAAYEDFCRNLDFFREIYPVKTICMHGSPLSKYDNRDIWKKYDYHNLGITGEPYFDVDFSKVLYLTDTGRRWDGEKVSVRDKVNSENKGIREKGKGIRGFRSTFDIIKAAENNGLPDKIMITVHPQRWTSNPYLWTKELVWQNLKNVVKRMVISD